MNENIDLTKILKDCPEGTRFWSDNYGEVQFLRIEQGLEHPIRMKLDAVGATVSYTKEGWFNINFPASCLLWPSKDCRDWSKFTAPWYKKEKFDPKTLQPFDRVIVRAANVLNWFCELFSYSYVGFNGENKFFCGGSFYSYCIPYNDDTKHLVGTKDEAPEYYRYWEE